MRRVTFVLRAALTGMCAALLVWVPIGLGLGENLFGSLIAQLLIAVFCWPALFAAMMLDVGPQTPTRSLFEFGIFVVVCNSVLYTIAGFVLHAFAFSIPGRKERPETRRPLQIPILAI